MQGKIVLVTGATDGIGRHTAKRLAAAGATVILHGRSDAKIAAAEQFIRSNVPSASLATVCSDLSTITGIRSLAEQILTKWDRLDVLINNAGIYNSGDRRETADGLEEVFAVNVVAPYMLNVLLLPLLTSTINSRVLNVSSTSQEEGDPHIVLNNLQLTHGWGPHESYSLSKLCIASISHELARRVTPDQLLVVSLDPGDVDTQMLRAGWPGYQGMKIEDANDEFKLATAPFDVNSHGKYFVACSETRCHPEVYDATLRLALWTELERITGIRL